MVGGTYIGQSLTLADVGTLSDDLAEATREVGDYGLKVPCGRLDVAEGFIGLDSRAYCRCRRVILRVYLPDDLTGGRGADRLCALALNLQCIFLAVALLDEGSRLSLV